jgi:hypothetical protein
MILMYSVGAGVEFGKGRSGWAVCYLALVLIGAWVLLKLRTVASVGG